MKKILCVILTMILILPFMQLIAYAYARIEVQSDPFSGDGEIVSFDVNENGEVPICVEDLDDEKIHTMIFDVQGNILCSLLIYRRGEPIPECAFQDAQNIALYPSRSSRVHVIDRLGNTLYDYSNENINTALVGLKKEAYYQDIQFKRNKTHSQIIKIQDGVEEVFYEVGVGNRRKTMQYRLVSMAHTLLAVAITCVVIRENRSKRQKERYGQ